jgi:hypothetical protein
MNRGTQHPKLALSIPRVEHSQPQEGLSPLGSDTPATLLNDGRVLVTGGTDSSGNATASAELYQ